MSVKSNWSSVSSMKWWFILTACRSTTTSASRSTRSSTRSTPRRLSEDSLDEHRHWRCCRRISNSIQRRSQPSADERTQKHRNTHVFQSRILRCFHLHNHQIVLLLAERERFELSVGVSQHMISRWEPVIFQFQNSSIILVFLS